MEETKKQDTAAHGGNQDTEEPTGEGMNNRDDEKRFLLDPALGLGHPASPSHRKLIDDDKGARPVKPDQKQQQPSDHHVLSSIPPLRRRTLIDDGDDHPMSTRGYSCASVMTTNSSRHERRETSSNHLPRVHGSSAAAAAAAAVSGVRDHVNPGAVRVRRHSSGNLLMENVPPIAGAAGNQSRRGGEGFNDETVLTAARQPDPYLALVSAFLVEDPTEATAHESNESTTYVTATLLRNKHGDGGNGDDDDDEIACMGSKKQRYLMTAILLITAIGINLTAIYAFSRNRQSDGPAYPSIVSDPPTPVPRFGTSKTTRYWDCHGGACGCGMLHNNDPDKPVHCHSNALFRAPANNPYNATYYGTAGISSFFEGDWWLGKGCGNCWVLEYEGVRIVVKSTNFCGSEYCGDQPHFVIAAPGFDSFPNVAQSVCRDRYNSSDAREDPEAFDTCHRWPEKPCNCSVFQDPVLREGCESFLDLGWDDPVVNFETLEECPSQLGSLPCWNENGKQWPVEEPEFCKRAPTDDDVHLDFWD